MKGWNEGNKDSVKGKAGRKVDQVKWKKERSGVEARKKVGWKDERRTNKRKQGAMTINVD